MRGREEALSYFDNHFYSKFEYSICNYSRIEMPNKTRFREIEVIEWQ
jgi:hypothetical protein